MKSRLIKKLLPFLCLLLSTTAFAKAKVETTVSNDFESLMGKDMPAWRLVQTKEDFENLAFFKKVFEDNKTLLSAKDSSLKIPKVIHFIWIGPKAFPRESVENIKTWIAKNPDWTVKFWTDRERPLPHPLMKLCFIKDFKFLKLEDCFNRSDNFGEKSDVWRYEILYQEGGVYADHDVKCLKSFDDLNATYDFYCGLEMPFKTPLSSSILPTNNLIGARAGHPILMKCMDWLVENWDQIEKDYPGKDREAVINRVSHRTYFVFGHMFKNFGNQEGRCDMAFPAFYFNAPQDELALWARHLYKGTWFENESAFEKMARERLMLLSKKVNKILLACGIMSALNLIGFIFLFLYLFRSHRKREKEA